MNNNRLTKPRHIPGIVLFSGLTFASLLAADTVIDPALKAQLSDQRQGIRSQQRIDQLDDQTQALLNEFRTHSVRLDDLTVYNNQMEHLIDDQKTEIDQKETQLRDIVTMQEQIAPFLQHMIEILEQFVTLDVPFLPDERRQRLEQLKQLMQRADITVTEKYRRIMEAYRIEAEYGHSIEAYQGTLNGGTEPRTVDFLRIGRVGLYYLTLKGDAGGFWDIKTKTWIQLPPALTNSLGKAIRIAQKQMPPDLMVLPVEAPEAAS